ncbi:hypothetical protein QW131_10180 [Roseibium salinum]|nr:hypothetical protein [Roseibium salinum]
MCSDLCLQPHREDPPFNGNSRIRARGRAKARPIRSISTPTLKIFFVWHNDLDQDTNRYLKINEASSFFDGLKDLALDETIAGYLSRYADFEFDIDYENWTVTFS